MDIIIHTHHNVDLPLELGFFDTVADIKHKLQTLTGVAVPRQSLLHNNTPLRDDWDIPRCNLFHRSRVSLLVRSPAPANPTSAVPLLVRLPLSKRHVTLDVGLKTRVDELKQRIGQLEGIASLLLTLFLRGRELEDERLVRECEGFERDDAVVEVGLVGSGGYAIDHLVVNVIIFLAPMNVKVPMALNVLQSFSDLRRQLERSLKENRISLPRDWFFVFGKERVMIECLAFEKFKVQNGDVLQVWTTSKMHHNSPETPPAMIKLEDASSPSPSEKVQIRLRMPSPISPISIEMGQNDTFSKLKDRIHDLEQIPTNRVSLHYSNKELQDQIPVREFDGREVGVSVKQSPTASFGSGASQSSSSRRLKLMVLPKNGTKRIPVEVNAGDSVGELRKELARLQEKMGFSLPAEGYFFIYKQNVMDDDQSFRWHDVGQGDTIEIFNGSVTGGS